MKNLLASFVFLSALPVFAGDDAVVQILKKHVQTSRDFTLEVANQMPAEQFTFKLTPEQMSFGEQMVHVANANGFFFGKMLNKKGPSFDPKKASKENAVAALKSAYDFVLQELSGVSDSRLQEIVDTGDGKMTMLEGVMLLLDHATNHRASAEMYLRVKGIKPAEYRF